MSSDTTSANTYDQDKEHSAVRFGQSFTHNNVKNKVERDPYAQFLVADIPTEALGAGFDFVDPDTEEPLKNNKEIRAIFDTFLPGIIKGEEIERTWGKAANLLRGSDNPLTDNEPFLRVFGPVDIDNTKTIFYNDNTIKQIKLTERDSLGNANDIMIPGEKITDTVNLFYDQKHYKELPHEERSYLEVFWDLIVGLEYIRMGATVFAIRVGAGMRFAMLPPDAPPDAVAEVKKGIKEWDSFNGVFILPKGAEIAIDTTSGTVDYELLKNVLLEALSTKSKVPLARLKGIEPGQLSGADVNERSLIDVYRTIQRAARAKINWLVEQLNEHYSWGLTADNWKPLWIVREQLNDMDKAELDDKIAQTTINLYNNELITLEEARETLGKDPNVTIEPRHVDMGYNEEGQEEKEETEETEEDDSGNREGQEQRERDKASSST